MATTLPQPGDRLGRYEILEQIGRGATGVVYKAADPQLKRQVAIKVIVETIGDAEAQALFTQEAEAIAALSHPNILTLHDVGTQQGLWYAVTELLHGQTLRARLAAGPLPVDDAVELTIEAAHGLAAAHAKNIVHLDLKPENLMVTDDGWLKILDFGVARIVRPAILVDEEVTRTHRPGRQWGTPAYMSPEQLCGDPVDHRSDLFSLGTILYEMLTGRHPFLRQTAAATMGAILREDPAPAGTFAPAVPPALDRIVRRSLKKSPAERFQSAREIRFALEAVREGLRKPDGSTTVTRRDGPSVAVLPFFDMSPARDEESFCDGIAEELINALTHIPGLRVAARTSAFQFKGVPHDVRQIGHILNVATVLDGSVRKHNNRLRVTVELIGTDDGYQLWSERFDRELEDVFAVQDEIATAVVKVLKGRFTGAPLVAPHTRDVGAYTAYLEGRYHWNTRTEDEIARSVECFKNAIARDSRYAEAYAGLADAYVTLATYGAAPPAVLGPLAKDALQKALDIDQDLADAYTCRGCVRAVFDWAWSDAERDFLQAIELEPAYTTAHHWYAINYLVPRGRFNEAREQLEQALHLEPLALAVRMSVGMTSYFAGEYDAAAQELLRTIQLDERFGMAHAFLAATCIEQRRYDRALSELEVALRLCGRTPEILATLGYLQGLWNTGTAARETLAELQELSRRRYVSPGRIAQVHVGLGEHDLALQCLEEACALRAVDLAWIQVRPVFAALRTEPRFQALVARVGGESQPPDRTIHA